LKLAQMENNHVVCACATTVEQQN